MHMKNAPLLCEPFLKFLQFVFIYPYLNYLQTKMGSHDVIKYESLLTWDVEAKINS